MPDENVDKVVKRRARAKVAKTDLANKAELQAAQLAKRQVRDLTAADLSKLIAADLSGRGKPQYSMYISIFTVVLTILLDLLLIPKANIQGAAVASSIAYLASAILYINRFCEEAQLPWDAVIIPRTTDFQLIFFKSRDIAKETCRKIKKTIQ